MKEVIGKEFQPISTKTIKVTIPYILWKEWNKDCEENFNGTRYLKMKFDHDFREQFSSVSNLIIRELEELRERVDFLEGALTEEKTNEEPVKKNLTFAERTTNK